jgi:hypothetical protein
MLSWLAAAAREVGREDGTSRTSVLKSAWKKRAAPMLERVSTLRSLESAKAQASCAPALRRVMAVLICG